MDAARLYRHVPVTHRAARPPLWEGGPPVNPSSRRCETEGVNMSCVNQWPQVWGVITVVIASVWACPAAAADTALDAPGRREREAIAARLEAIQSIRVEYDIVDTRSPLGGPVKAAANSGSGLTGGQAQVRSSARFGFLYGQARWEERWPRERNPGVDQIVELIHTFTEGATQQLVVRAKPLGSVDSRPTAPEIRAVDLGLGLRKGYRGDWMTSADILSMDISRDAQGHVVLREVGAHGQPYEWHFDPSLGYALIQHQRRYQEPPYPPVNDVVASDFRLVDGVLLPHKIVERIIHTNGDVVRTWEATVKAYALRPLDNVPDSYQIAWPMGTKVLDARTRNLFVIHREGQTLNDEQMSRATRPQSQSPSGIATTLPVTDEPARLVRWQGPGTVGGMASFPNKPAPSTWMRNLALLFIGGASVVGVGIALHRRKMARNTLGS